MMAKSTEIPANKVRLTASAFALFSFLRLWIQMLQRLSQ